MTGAISYSLFGFAKETPKNCFEFSSYMRGLMVNVRVNRVIYPGWTNIVNTDNETYTSKYQPIFDWLLEMGFIELNICPSNEPLCMAMLWRLKPVFDRVWDDVAQGHKGWKYTHVLCRDIDSVCTYREAQAVQQWIQEDKTIHCITDSVSHNIPMMGGMIGMRPAYFTERLGVQFWADLIQKSKDIDFKRKGSDQDFLARYVYPKCADSATEHFILGMVHNLPEGNGRHYFIDDVPVAGVDVKYKNINEVCGHCGASGYYENIMVKWLNTVDPYRDQYKDIESKFTQLFFWRG